MSCPIHMQTKNSKSTKCTKGQRVCHLNLKVYVLILKFYLKDEYLKYGQFQLYYRVMAADSSDGVMTADEMRRYLFSEVKTSYADHELQEMFTALDQDNDGKVKMEDFVRLLATENSVDVQDDSPNCAEYCVIL